MAPQLAKSKGCAIAYSDNSFRVAIVRVCPLSSNLEIIEAVYIQVARPSSNVAGQ